MDKVVLTPHIGGATYDTEVNHTPMIAERHRPGASRASGREHCANPEVLP